jgi:hypothetical protein
MLSPATADNKNLHEFSFTLKEGRELKMAYRKTPGTQPAELLIGKRIPKQIIKRGHKE